MQDTFVAMTLDRASIALHLATTPDNPKLTDAICAKFATQFGAILLDIDGDDEQCAAIGNLATTIRDEAGIDED